MELNRVLEEKIWSKNPLISKPYSVSRKGAMKNRGQNGEIGEEEGLSKILKHDNAAIQDSDN